MNRPKLLRALSFIWSLVFLTGMANAQVQVEGTVYDMTQQYPMRGVSVVSTGGRGTMTDSLGRYRIVVAAADSLYFSYLGRGTAKFPVKDLPPGYPFDMSLQVAVDTLPAATVWNPSYRLDSLENRKEYRKAFDYEGGMLHDMKMERRPGFGVGLDLDMLIDGKVDYACTTRLAPREMVLEPLPTKAPLRDLVTEITPPDERLDHALAKA